MRHRVEGADSHQCSLFAARALGDIDAGQAQHHDLWRFWLWRLGLGLTLQGSAGGEFPVAVSITEQAIMADAGESERQDMQQEAADELIGVQAHGLLAIAVGVIAPAKAHVLSVEINQAVVGDGNLVRVAPEVGQHLSGAGERWFGIDHPVVGAKCGFETGECVGLPLQFAVSVGCREQFEVFAAEYHGQGSGGEQKAISSGQPAFAVGAECAPGDNRVDMDVLIEILSPGVQHHGDTDFAADPARIATELEQGLRGGFEQQAVDESGVALGNRIEVMRQCENEMPVADVEESAALLLDPADLFESLALGAVAVST